MGKRVIVIGSNFAGMTAAIELKEMLGRDHTVVVISKDDYFSFMPSLIWVPFGLRTRDEITFPLMPINRAKGIEYHNAPVTGIDLRRRLVTTSRSEHGYDYLIIATGPKLNYDAVPGLGPKEGFTQSIFSLEDAEAAARAFEEFLEAPGPVVVGAVQGASWFSAAYEFLFNMAHQIQKRGLEEVAPLTFVTPEPYVAHLGMGGFHGATAVAERYLRKLNVTVETNASVREILPDVIHLEGGHSLPFAYAMLTPPFVGVDPVRACSEIVDGDGFVRVNQYYQTDPYPEVFAAGVSVSIDPPEKTPVPCGVPKSGYLSDRMARTVAHNVAASIHGGEMTGLPPATIDTKGVLDTGKGGVIMSGDHLLEPREHSWLIPGPEAHWAKVAFERYFLTTRRHGNV